MTIYSKTYTFSANTTIQSAQVNANFDEIATAINTTLFSGTGNSLLTTKGGTGLTSYTTGDVLYASATNVLSKLAAGTNGAILKQASGVPSWLPPSTDGSILYQTSSAPSWLAVGANGTVLTSSGSVPQWTVIRGYDSSTLLYNLGLAVTANGGIMTIELKQYNGSDPSTGLSDVRIGFREPTSTTGTYNVRAITSSLSMTLGGTTTLGTNSGSASYVYVYALDNAGTITLGASINLFDEGSLQSSSTTGTSNQVIYQASALSSKPIRLIGRFLATNSAGAWASPTEISLAPFTKDLVVSARYTTTNTQTFNNGVGAIIATWTRDYDSHNAMNATTGVYTCPMAGKYRVSGKNCVDLGASAQYEIQMNIRKNTNPVSQTLVSGALGAGQPSYLMTVPVTDTINCAAGDTIDLFYTQASGGNRTQNATAILNIFTIERIGA